MKIAVLKEAAAGETRCAAIPDTVKRFAALGAELAVERGAGENASIPDSEFEAAGASIGSRQDVLRGADVILCVDGPEPESLAGAVDTCLELVDVLETNRRFTNLSPHGEPQLGRRGLYRSAGGAVSSPDDERALLWVLNLSDGGASLLDIARRSGILYPMVRRAAERLESVGLLAPDVA